MAGVLFHRDGNLVKVFAEFQLVLLFGFGIVCPEEIVVEKVYLVGGLLLLTNAVRLFYRRAVLLACVYRPGEG